MKLLKRTRCVVFSTLLLVVASSFGNQIIWPPPASADAISDEARFVQRINIDRIASGLTPLVVIPRLSEIARGWSRVLGQRSVSLPDCVLAHNSNLLELLGPARKVAENVGCGDGTADLLHDAFMNSLHHRNNILDPVFDSVGVGVVVDGPTMFVSVEFVRSVPVAPMLAPLSVLPLVAAAQPPVTALPKAVVVVPVPGVPLANTKPQVAKVAPKSRSLKVKPKKVAQVAPKPFAVAFDIPGQLTKKTVAFSRRALRIKRLLGRFRSPVHRDRFRAK